MNLISIPSLSDNYIWFLYDNKRQCLIVDPGETAPVLQVLSEHHLIPVAIFLTHHHFDHLGGVSVLRQYFSIPIYGPEETRDKGATQIITEGDHLVVLKQTFKVLSIPGHTLGHIGFYSDPWLFCGDTIFSAGCGRIIEGTSKQMYFSLQKINQLPPETLICAAHEYTLDNLNFAVTLLPSDQVIINYQHEIRKLRLKNQSSLPTTLRLERLINVFLRCHDINLKKNLGVSSSPKEEWNIFEILRKRKDNFK